MGGTGDCLKVVLLLNTVDCHEHGKLGQIEPGSNLHPIPTSPHTHGLRAQGLVLLGEMEVP